MLLTAQEVYNKLIDDDKILELQGQIKFYFGDVDIIVKQKDVVGNIIQEWLQGWLDKRGIEYTLSQNTQMPPDFYLNPDNKTIDLLEVKEFVVVVLQDDGVPKVSVESALKAPPPVNPFPAITEIVLSTLSLFKAVTEDSDAKLLSEIIGNGS